MAKKKNFILFFLIKLLMMILGIPIDLNKQFFLKIARQCIYILKQIENKKLIKLKNISRLFYVKKNQDYIPKL